MSHAINGALDDFRNPKGFNFILPIKIKSLQGYFEI